MIHSVAFLSNYLAHSGDLQATPATMPAISILGATLFVFLMMIGINYATDMI
jgi:hypothetical protein